MQGIGVATGQQAHSRGIHLKQLRVRVITRGQAHQQLIEVITGQQGLTRGHDVAAHPFGRFEGADVAVATKSQRQRLQRQEHRAKARRGPFGPFGHQSHPAMLAGEDLEDQAGFAPVVAVQHIGWLLCDPLGGHWQWNYS